MNDFLYCRKKQERSWICSDNVANCNMSHKTTSNKSMMIIGFCKLVFCVQWTWNPANSRFILHTSLIYHWKVIESWVGKKQIILFTICDIAPICILRYELLPWHIVYDLHYYPDIYFMVSIIILICILKHALLSSYSC